ncbi:hypothetical protein, partial [Methylobacterium brachythecii]|uniref:hypothetical protein n=1 Tax=Methylobacterium brachythecii TaxID=1176177 RepID=UPI0024E16788
MSFFTRRSSSCPQTLRSQPDRNQQDLCEPHQESASRQIVGKSRYLSFRTIPLRALLRKTITLRSKIKAMRPVHFCINVCYR